MKRSGTDKTGRAGLRPDGEQAINHKQMLKLFLTIALPVALQNLLTYAVGLMDSIMVGSLGEVQLSAVTVANQPFFVRRLRVDFPILGQKG